MKIYESAEDYLEAILSLQERHGMVRSIDIANELHFSKPSVSVAMKKLRESGYITMDKEGLITLKEGAGITATKADIAENPKNLDIVELEANQLPVRLADVDMAVINGNYAIDAGLKVADAVAIEAADGEAATAYVNVLAVKEGNEDSPAIQALAAALTSQEVKDFIDETYAGAVVPVF